MKTLSNYISEKLIINKNFVSSYYNSIQPKSEGRCLKLSISTAKNTGTHRIEITTCEYQFDGQKIDFPLRDSYGFEKNNEGYFWRLKKGVINDVWADLLLFDEDAKKFLEILLNNQNTNINLSCLFDDKDNKLFNWPYKVGWYNEKGIVDKFSLINKSEVKYAYDKIC